MHVYRTKQCMFMIARGKETIGFMMIYLTLLMNANILKSPTKFKFQTNNFSYRYRILLTTNYYDILHLIFA